jgi:DNA polymerase-3 subunit gamma/tau
VESIESAPPAVLVDAILPEGSSQPPSPPRRTTGSSYTVVARRYRPQRFEDVVGQEHVVQSLQNGIRLNRLAQAYLFCGTRGVGKTSMARIFAKCLNCVKGPTATPCQTCDICQSIASGQDVDVIEIDGASNNGVEQVRELRQNASLRPSRCRYKIYYIDEVHMLSTGAFNALLKTLEEPPPHVKFFFATTEPTKIPITVLSRCQRYDFAGITPEAIANALGEICSLEGVEAEPEALQVVARRAGGSLRDAQSLLDRLMASGSSSLTVDVVHSLLGTATDERLLKMVDALADHDAAAALGLLEQSSKEGVQPAELLGGLIDLVRDAMVLSIGAESILLAISPRNKPQLKRIVERWTQDSILAALQVLQECRARMRGSIHGRLLLETALVRVARLENLTSLSTLVERLTAVEAGAPPHRLDSAIARMRASPPETPHLPPAPVSARAQTRPDPPPAAPVSSSAQTRPDPPPAAPLSSPAQTRPDPPPAAPLSSPVEERSNPPALAQSSAAAEAAQPDRDRAPLDPGGGARATPPEIALAAEGATPAVATAVMEAPTADPGAESHTLHARDEPALDLDAVRKVWPDLVKKVGTGLGWKLSQVEPIELDGPDVLVIAAKPGYNSTFDECGTPEAQAKIAQALQRLIHRPVKIKYERRAVQDDKRQADSRPTKADRADSLASDPMVQRVLELFEARSVQLDYDEEDPSPQD